MSIPSIPPEIFPSGWYRQGNCIRWWDGDQWTELCYPKKWGITWGGGTHRGSITSACVAGGFAFLFYCSALQQFRGGMELAGVLLCICIGALFFVGVIALVNAYYVQVLEAEVAAYEKRTGVRPPL